MKLLNDTVTMIAPPAEVEAAIYHAKCKKCGGIISDSSWPVEVSSLKPEDVKSQRIKCHHRYGKNACGHLNFVRHK